VTLVVDASLLLACVLPDESSDAAVAAVAEQLRSGEALLAPFHLPVELLSGIEQAARRGRVKKEDRVGTYAAAIEPGIELVTLPVEGDRSTPPLFELVDRSGLRAYDGLYIQLALARRAPLASLDDALRRAAVMKGIEVVPEPALASPTRSSSSQRPRRRTPKR